MVNPFKYGREVSGRQFYDRQEAFNSLYSKLAGGSANVVMYAPRRYGKTSLVKKVLSRFSEEGVPCVYFDLNRVESLERFCEAYASALYSLVGGAFDGPSCMPLARPSTASAVASLPSPPATRRRSPSCGQWCHERCRRGETQNP